MRVECDIDRFGNSADKSYDSSRMPNAFWLKLAMSQGKTSPWVHPRTQGTSSVYETDRKYNHIGLWELLNNIANRIDITLEDCVESKELEEFLDRFRIKEVG